MKQSTGRLSEARLLSRQAVLGIAAAVAVVAGLAACGGNNKNNNCHNLPQATAVVGQTAYSIGTPNTGGASGATLGGPQGSVASNGTLFYVADTGNHRILGYSAVPTGITGAASFIIGQADAKTVTPGTAPVSGSAIKFFYPSKVSIGTTGSATYLVVADSSNNRVLIWNSLPTTNVAPDVVLGQPDLTTGDANHPGAVPNATNLSNPTGAYIANGYLVVVDKGNNRVLIWKGIPTASNTAASLVLGQKDFASYTPGIDVFSSTSNSYTLAMNQPSDVWTDGARLVITDTGNHRVLFWAGIPNVSNALAANVIGFGQFGQTSSSGSTGTQGLHSPWGVSSDGISVFVADTGNNRVLEFPNYLTIPSNGPSATYVFGQADPRTGNTANDPDQNGSIGDQRNNPATNGVTAGALFNPQGVFATSSGKLFVTDSGNNRVLMFAISAGVDGSNTQDSNHCF